MPALVAVVAVSLAFGWFTLLPEEFAQLGQHAAAGILFVENIKLFWEVGYFDTAAATKPLLHLWSLSIEEQLYLAFPAGMLVASRFKVAPTLVIGITLLVSLGLCLWMARQNASAAFYLPQYWVWEILSGALLACVVRRSR